MSSSEFVSELIAVTTGKDTIYQMIDLAEEVEKRGGSPSIRWTTSGSTAAGCWLRIEHRLRR